jgi:cytochrome c biogenesis protein CcmG, thiol:disulfide interchange protein DsbE
VSEASIMALRVPDAAPAAVRAILLRAPQAPRARSKSAGASDPASAAPATTCLKRVALLAMAGLALAAPAGAQDGGLDLGRYKGKVVYLDFWASWCGPCKLSFPYMNRLSEAHAGDGLVVLAVDVDRSRDKADLFLSQIKNRLPVVYDPQGQMARKFQVKAMPTSLLIGRDGRIRYVHDGFFPAKIPAYEAQISELLHETP